MRKLSIGVRLTIWYLVIFAVAQTVFGASMWLILRHNLYRMTDQALGDQVDDLVRFLETQKKNASVAKLQEEVAEAYIIEHSGDYLQVSTEGIWIFQSEFLHRNALPQQGGTNRGQYYQWHLGGKSFRFITQTITVNDRTYMVQTGLPLDQVLHILSEFRIGLLMLSPVLFVAAAFGGYWLSRRALAPVDAITNSAQTIGAGNLNSRLEIPRTEDELQRLSLTLNRMLERIEGAFLRVTQFTADASHELRTPVALIHTEAELALRRSRSQSEYRETLHHILLEAQRTAVLIEQLLALARADSGTEALKFRPIKLNEVISDVASCWRQVAVIKKVSFREEIVRSSADLDADEAAIRRVVTILLDNAFKFSSSMVALQANEQKDKFVISVLDDGPGIPLEDQGKVFERFYRVDKARSRELGGAGLGLSIARWIVAQHKGLLTVESIPGTGSTFRVELPRLSVLTAERVAARKNGMNGRP